MPFSITWNIFFILHYSSIQGATKIKVNSENLRYLLNANFFYTWYIWNSSHFIACRKRRLITNASFLYCQNFYISNILKFPRIFVDVFKRQCIFLCDQTLFQSEQKTLQQPCASSLTVKHFILKLCTIFWEILVTQVKQPNFPDAQIPAHGEQKNTRATSYKFIYCEIKLKLT